MASQKLFSATTNQIVQAAGRSIDVRQPKCVRDGTVKLKSMSESKDKALTLLQLLVNTGATFEDENLALSIIEENIKRSNK